MGAAFRSLAMFVESLIKTHKPDVIAIARPFIGRVVTPVQLGPIMAFPCRIHEIADEHRIPFRREYEPDARRAFIGAGQTPRKSKDIKVAVIRACAMRGWEPKDSHAADALCVADFVLNQLEPHNSHRSTPLFISAGQYRSR